MSNQEELLRAQLGLANSGYEAERQTAAADRTAHGAAAGPVL